ncbi:LOW QUALITY PROTEIN: ralBP1-associated Eps domain-containing protein 2 [Osmerus mordax]|uniref:LOW QUALITY PROTEIN: ralBP1-associated Eps domain-containing protein 2 n=1 Tax=Osmerus mordax TaxID=8014 RepID=UPI003510CE11
MDPAPGIATTGRSFISLNENEQICYSGLHSLCQADGSGKLSASKVGELLRASQLPTETLHQVTEVSGAQRLGCYGNVQFYVALKLLAAAQAGYPVLLDSLAADLPLPRFPGMKSEAEPRFTAPPVGLEAQGQPCPPPGAPSWAAGGPRALRHLDAGTERKEVWSPPRSPASSPPPSPSAYHSYPYALQRNGADTLLAYDSKLSLRPTIQPEHHSSPGRHGSKAFQDPSSLVQGLSGARLEERVVSEQSEDPWRITEEQREYYTHQFRTLQPDLGALILGTIAKNFFTKSKLPIPELSHIWELSDVDRDGALTFSEFCTAFHLIVARKNGYALPETLPPPCTPPPCTPPWAWSWQGAPWTPPKPQRVQRPSSSLRMHIPDNWSSVSLQRAPSSPPRAPPRAPPVPGDIRQESSISRAVVSPQEGDTTGVGTLPRRPEPLDLDPSMKSRTRPRSFSSTSIDEAMKKKEEPPTPPPRPQKTHSRASSLDLNKLLQQGIKSVWGQPPPALPPRPPTSQVPVFQGSAETSIKQPNFADFTRFREEEESSVKPDHKSPSHRLGSNTEDLTNTPKQELPVVPQGHAPQKPVRRKYRPESQNLEATPPPVTPFAPPTKQKLASRMRREIQMTIRKNKETNAVLTRLNSELQQQLKDVHQERVTLESQLEVLRPLPS